MAKRASPLRVKQRAANIRMLKLANRIPEEPTIVRERSRQRKVVTSKRVRAMIACDKERRLLARNDHAGIALLHDLLGAPIMPAPITRKRGYYIRRQGRR